MMRGVNDPYIVVLGQIANVQDCALVCNGKIMLKLSHVDRVLTWVLVLMAFCHVFHLEYNIEVKEAMHFLQEKLLGIVESKGHTTAIVNLFRSISCLQEQIDMRGQQ